MNRSVLCVLLLIAVAQCACTSSSALLREPGTFAYSGDSVVSRGTMFERTLMGSDANQIDITSAQQPAHRFERVIVYVEEARIADLSKNDTIYSPDQLRAMVTEAARDAVSSFGRFERTSDRSRAEIVLLPTLYSINTWADTKMSKEEVNSAWGSVGSSVTGAAVAKVNREAIDAYCGVVLSRVANGNEFASRRATGRLIANQGQAIESGTYVVSDVSGGGQTIADVQHAKLKPTELVRAIRTGVEGAVAEVLAATDTELWEPVGSSGTRTKRFAGVQAP